MQHWKQGVQSSIEEYWDALPEAMQTQLRSYKLGKKEPETALSPQDVSKRYKEASVQLRQLEQQKLALQGKLDKARNALQAVEAEFASLEKKLQQAQADMDQATALYNARILAPETDSVLGPESPQLQRLELQAKLASLVEKFGDKLSADEKASLGGIAEVLEKINELEVQPWKKRKTDEEDTAPVRTETDG